jgi:hypothetical protein
MPPGRLDFRRVRAARGSGAVEEALAKLVDQRRPMGAMAVRHLLGSETPLAWATQVSVPALDLRMYDTLLEGGVESE